MTNSLVVWAAALSALLFLVGFSRQKRSKQPPEPPAVSLIAFIAHWYNHGNAFSFPANLPIYLVNLFFVRICIVADPAWLKALGRNKNVQFHQFLNILNEKLGGLSPSRLKPFHDAPDGADLNRTMFSGIKNTMCAANVGPMSAVGLKALPTIMSRSVATQDNNDISLYHWTRHVAGLVLSESMYGSNHPLKDEKIENAFWNFEENASPPFAHVPRFLKGDAVERSRDVVARVFERYYQDGSLQDGSPLTKFRYQLQHDAGFTDLEIATMEAAFAVASMAGSPGSTFYTIWNIVSRQQLLKQIRDELEPIVTKRIGSDKHEASFSVSILAVRDQCPLLLSTFQETLRERSTFNTGRFIAADTVVQVGETAYTLRKDTFTILPPYPSHNNKDAWGPDTAIFDPERFMKLKQQGNKNTWRFRAFGGPPSLCPGRHLGTTEVLATVAAILLQFDIVSKEWIWEELNQDYSKSLQAFCAPLKDPKVRVIPRSGWQGRWTFELGAETLSWPLECG